MLAGRKINRDSLVAEKKGLDFLPLCVIVILDMKNALKVSVATCFPSERKGHRL